MNFKEFVDTGKLEKFRKIKIDLTDEGSDVDDLVSEVDTELLELRNILNKKLKKDYRGKLKIDFCITEYINKRKANDQRTKTVRDRFQKYLLEANDIMAKAKTDIERSIKKG
jgi:hypothetical protein